MKRAIGIALLLLLFSACGVVATSEEEFSDLDVVEAAEVCEPADDDPAVNCNLGSD